jgi:hypothetical protein
MDGFLKQRISTLTEEEIDKIFQGRFSSEIPQEELEQKEDLYCSKLSEAIDADHVKTYSHSEAWK